MNASPPTREARQFPPRPANDEKLNQFLVKACWYAGIEEAALEMFDTITKSDGISIDYSLDASPPRLSDYIEIHRMKLWDYACPGVFKGSNAFKKSDSFKDFKGSLLAVKRLIYRYFKFDCLRRMRFRRRTYHHFLRPGWIREVRTACSLQPK